MEVQGETELHYMFLCVRGCNPIWTFLGINPIGHNGTYFCIDMCTGLCPGGNYMRTLTVASVFLLGTLYLCVSNSLHTAANHFWNTEKCHGSENGDLRDLRLWKKQDGISRLKEKATSCADVYICPYFEQMLAFMARDFSKAQISWSVKDVKLARGLQGILRGSTVPFLVTSL